MPGLLSNDVMTATLVLYNVGPTTVASRRPGAEDTASALLETLALLRELCARTDTMARLLARVYISELSIPRNFPVCASFGSSVNETAVRARAQASDESTDARIGTSAPRLPVCTTSSLIDASVRNEHAARLLYAYTLSIANHGLAPTPLSIGTLMDAGESQGFPPVDSVGVGLTQGGLASVPNQV
ncbi:hypothetical protein AURDEDRAFT_153362 [Auricularia subglabra TFB-10046 SS5]|nr:hypothetical protein AURDEDRAFT_153362 [Auricularia subglabra TFB-10046 SS5]